MKKPLFPLVLTVLCLVVFLSAAPVQAADSDYLSFDQAVIALRQGLKDWESVVTVHVRSDSALSSDAGSMLMAQAVAHTGVPDEGDYLRRNMNGYHCNTSWYTENGVYYYTFELIPNWFSTAQQEAEVDAAVDALLAELDLWNEDNYGKIVGVYNWVTENILYDYDNADDEGYLLKHSTYSALIQRNTVCQGYATLLYRLLLSLDVDCRYLSGMADDESHAWNIVCLDGKYYNVDATWDRGLMGYYRYFLCTEANFGDHIRNEEFTTDAFLAQYPMAIVPYVRNAAASGTIRPGLEWVLDGDTGILTVSGTGAIPSYRYSYAPWYDYRESVRGIVISQGITEVGERAFYWCTNCTSVTLPDSLIAIREYGFNNLRSLQQITLPENLEIIEFCAFSECAALSSITLPDSVHTVGSSAFSNCPGLTTAKLSAGMTSIPSSMFFNDTMLWKVEMPDSITSIGSTAFMSCSLYTFHLPAALTSIGTSAFGDNHHLTSFTVDSNNPSFKSINGVLFSKDGKTLLCYPAGKSGSYTVPEGTETIAYGAFRGNWGLWSINFGSTLREIGSYAFSYCTGLSSVTFPANVTRIGEDSFRSCTYLYNVYFQNPSVTLESGVFAECDSLYSVTLPSNLTQIPGYLFYGCANLQSFTIPSTVQSIGSSAFLDCDRLVSITIPGNVKSIGRQAFDYCNRLETFVMETGVTRLEDYCIRNCPNLKRVLIPDTVTSIGRENFDLCPVVNLEVSCSSTGHSYALSHGLNHTVSHPCLITETYPPTCTEWGYIITRCRCGEAWYRTDNAAPLGHLPGIPVRENEDEYGSYEEVIYCDRCCMELSRVFVSSHTPGDINGDGEVDNKDVTRLFRYLSCYEVEVVEAALDVNGDGEINNKDVTRLFRYLSGWDVEIF